MNDQDRPKSFMNRLAAFVMGWGFYIVLFLCVAVVGISAWSLISAGKRAIGDGEGEPGDMEAVVTSPGSSYRPEDFLSPGLEADAPAQPEPPDLSQPEPQTEPESPAEETDLPEAEPSQAPEPLYFIWPVKGSVDLPYAMETLVYNKTMNDWRSHSGLDIAAELGSKVSAVARGQVESVYEDPLYGTTVVIDHGEGLKSLYCNLAATPTVSEGDSVAVGDVIGAVGSTALIEVAAPNHLHLEMQQDGLPVDPCQYLPEQQY